MSALAPVVAVIPARLGSTRFPRKVLANRTGRPLIQHVHESALGVACLDRVVIATDADEVAEAARGFGAEVVLTRADHPNGTSRIAEAADELGLGSGTIVVNIQGDEPEIEPSLVGAMVGALESSGAPTATVAVPMPSGDDPGNPNIVKVVANEAGLAMYFSRSPIPHRRDPHGPPVEHLRHVGMYAYRREFLPLYAGLAPTAIERIEQLEQLRVLAHGHAMAVAVVRGVPSPAGIDTPEQYEAFVRRWSARR